MFRGFLGAGEAICFGLDSISVPYVKEAGVIFCFYATGVIIFIYLAAFHIEETKYFTNEDGVVIPTHVLEEHDVVEGKDATPENTDNHTMGKQSNEVKISEPLA